MKVLVCVEEAVSAARYCFATPDMRQPHLGLEPSSQIKKIRPIGEMKCDPAYPWAWDHSQTENLVCTSVITWIKQVSQFRCYLG